MNITIVGLGLIGGSLGLALRATSLDLCVTGWDRDTAAVALAYQRGAIEHGSDSLAEAVASADVVVVATPVLAVQRVFELIAPHLRDGTIVTDVASTKKQVMDWAAQLLPPFVTFVGGHPMAGSEQHGIAHARGELLHGATYCLTPRDDTPDAAIVLLEQLVIAMNARPLRLDAAAHDAYVAAVSHLPFMLSAALIQQTAADEHWTEMRRLAATGFRDVTRLASGDPLMHRDICLTNARALGDELREMARRLETLAAQLDDSSALEAFFNQAKHERDAWLRERDAPQ